MKYYIVAGEASGDLHGSRLVEEINSLDANADIRGWGGDKMTQAGAKIIKHYRDLAFMGFVEVAKNIRTILGNLKFCKQDIEKFNPDALILIDYPGFNLRIAKWAHQQGIRVFYYISPQIWAWNVKRVHQIGKYVHRMFVILPFEKAFYKEHGYDVTYVGHPLKEVIDDFTNTHPVSEKKHILLLPGSRKQEIRLMLPLMIELANEFQDYSFVIAQAPSIDSAFYQNLISHGSNVELSNQGSYPLLTEALAAITTSGTATLETALFKVPQIVCYKGNAISYQIARRLIRVPFISLVNLIAERKIVPELIQGDYNLIQLRAHLQSVLSEAGRKAQFDDYEDVHRKLEFDGSPPIMVASEIIRYIREDKN